MDKGSGMLCTPPPSMRDQPESQSFKDLLTNNDLVIIQQVLQSHSGFIFKHQQV